MDARRMNKAVIFDIDGTLLDSVDLHARSWVESFNRFGVDAKFEDVRRHIGEGADRLMPAFLPKDTSEARKKTIEQFRSTLFKERYLPLVRPFPKVRELFERLKSDGLRIVLGSSCTAEEINWYKEIAEIGDLAECETTSDDADSSKPAPDIFNNALKQIYPIEAAECVVIGDTRYDGEAAFKAGMPFIGLLCGGSSERELKAARAVAIYKDPEDLLVNCTDLYALPGNARPVPTSVVH
jgi:HAD superfamily hydrolase (TIGR01549 family)